jgi:hypothetical protein
VHPEHERPWRGQDTFRPERSRARLAAGRRSWLLVPERRAVPVVTSLAFSAHSANRNDAGRTVVQPGIDVSGLRA